MQYKKFKNEINLSRLGLGIMRLPVLEAQPEQPIDYEKAKKNKDSALLYILRLTRAVVRSV